MCERHAGRCWLALAPLVVGVCVDHLKVDSFGGPGDLGMRKLPGVSGNGFAVLRFGPLQRIFFLKLGSMAWVLGIGARRKQQSP